MTGAALLALGLSLAARAQEAAPDVFEQRHATTDFGVAPARSSAAPRESLAQIARALDDLEAREAAQTALIDAQYRERCRAFLSDEGFRGLAHEQRTLELRRLAADRYEQLRGLKQTIQQMRDVLLRRFKELSR